MTRFLSRVRGIFVAGTLVTVPAVITIIALRVLFQWFDGILGPWVARLINRDLPGLGLAASIVLIFIMGVLATNFLGRRMIAVTESIFSRVPLVRRIYKTSKEIVEAATLPDRRLFREVVMVEYPRKGLHIYGFVTNYSTRVDDGDETPIANVFIPNPPIPTTGVLVAVPVTDIHHVDISIDEALKLILSAGVVTPKQLRFVDRPRE